MVLLFSLLILSAQAAVPKMSVQVQTPGSDYSLQIGPRFEYRSSKKTLSRSISACDERAYVRFARRLHKAVLENWLSVPAPPQATASVRKQVQATLNGQSRVLSALSPAGLFLSRMDNEVDYLVSEAVYRCANVKK